ncbi:mechanosensitive ion channel family protein [Peptoniphilus sp. ING2-D1G]|nr:mechanosensitive ion channel family protein [Peptoniphilus sp. ING2-D1G]
MNEYFKLENGELNLLGKVVSIFGIILVAHIISNIISSLIKKNIYSKENRDNRNFMRVLTVVKLIDKIVKVVIYFLAITISLDIVGINTSSIIATVGLGSLALSFGAQSLVKDVINGFFLILEDQYSVGDSVVIEDKIGIVEELGIRTTTIRDFSGDLHIIPNGEIKIVTNKQRGQMRAKVDFSVDISEDPKRIIKLLKEKIAYLYDDKRSVKEPSIWGVTKNSDDGYNITVVAYADPPNQYDIEYEIRQKVVELFIEEGINPPKFRTEVKNC